MLRENHYAFWIYSLEHNQKVMELPYRQAKVLQVQETWDNR